MLQKIWWFSFLLVVAPLAVGFVGFWIFSLFRGGLLIALSLSVITYMFALLFFYKAFDKYRDRPFFLNKENNLNARIHIVFLISMLSLIVTPIFTLISPPNISFVLLPIIGFATLYNIVYFYYYFQPIDFFNKADGEFKHATNLKLMMQQPYNFIIVINYIVHIVFLSFIYRIELSWLFALVNNLVFYIITLVTTQKDTRDIKDSIKEEEPVLESLTRYKRKFVILITSLIFILLIQMPFVTMIIFSLTGIQYSILELMNGSFLSVIFLFIYVKSIFYINYYYNSLLSIYIDSEEVKGIKYQKYNTFVSGVLIGSITFFCFLIRMHWIVLVVLPFFFIFAYYEQKANMCPKQYNKYILLLNFAGILIAISFGLFSGVFLLNIQFIIFLISLYFALQVLVKMKYFVKEDIIIVQNILAIATFTIITYSFFGFTTFENLYVFELAIFTSNPIVIHATNILMHGTLVSIISLISFYILNARLFSIKRSKLFRISVIIHIILIESLIFTLINIRIFNLFVGMTAVRLFIVSSLLFPVIFIFFILANYLLGILSRKNFSISIYFCIWILIMDIFLVLFIVFLDTTVMLVIDFLFLSVFSQLNLKFGLKIEKVRNSSYERYVKLNAYLLTFEFIALFYFIFYSIILLNLALYDRIILSSYFSLLIFTIMVNIFSKRESLFSKSIAFKINLLTLLSSAWVAFFYSFLYTMSTFFMYLFPFLSLFSILIFPLYYLYRVNKYEKTMPKLMMTDFLIVSLFITLIPSLVSLEMDRQGMSVDIFPIISYTLLILPCILIFFVFISNRLGFLSRDIFLQINYYILWLLIVDIFLAIILSFLNNYVIITVVFLFLSIFSQLNLNYGLKLGRIKDTTVKRFVNINSYAMTVELFTLFFFFFYSIVLVSFTLYNNIVFSVYFSLLILAILGNLLSRMELIFSISMSIIINQAALIFSAGLAFYYSFLYTLGTFYVFLIPLLCLFSLLFFPLYYVLKMKRYEKFTRKVLVINCILLAIFVALIPTIVSLDLYFHFNVFVDIFSVVNFTLYIAFGLLILIYFLVKHYKLKDKYRLGFLKSQVLIEIALTGTTVFYYVFILLSATVYRFLIPFIVASCFFYLPTIFSYKRQLFKENLMKNAIFINSFLLSGFVVLVPAIVGLELLRLGFQVDFLIVTAISLVLLFAILKFLDFICVKFKMLEKITKHLKLLELLSWFSFSLFTVFWMFPYLMIQLSFSLSLFVFFILNIYSLRLISDYSKELKFSKYIRETILYGIVFSSSYLLVSLIQFTNVLFFLPLGLASLNFVWTFGIFFLFNLLFIRSKIIDLTFDTLRNWVELISWFIFKIFICIFVSLSLPLSIYVQIITFILVFSMISPISLAYFKNLEFISEETQFLARKIFLAVYIFAILILYLEIFDIFTRYIPSFNIFNLVPLSVIIANLYLFLYFCILRYNWVIDTYSTSHVIKYYIPSLLLIISLFFMYFPIPVFTLFTLALILSQRSIINIFRFIAYIFLGYSLFIVITAFPYGGFVYLTIFNLNLVLFYSQNYLICLSTVLLFSIWIKNKKNNMYEKFGLYTCLSLLSFVLLYLYTPILLLYNFTISLFLFLFFMGIYFYRQKNVLYQWFIKPCVLLAVFDFISFLSYFLFFSQPPYASYSPILTTTLTTGITGFIFVLLFNRASARFRRISFYLVLISITLCIPIFLYFLLISSFSIPFTDTIPLIFSINVGVFLFYLSIGIYQWRISWAIWKSGWYAWNILPFVNFIIIYRSLSGIDVVTNSLNLFGAFEFSGSSILSIIICSLFFLPVIYTKIKKYFLKVVFIVWGESLFLLYWISQNLFTDFVLRNLIFVVLAVLLVVPILIGLKYWKIVSVFWITLIIINASFLFFYLVFIGISLEVTISVDILVIGLLMVVYSFFPNVRSIGIVLIISYFIVLTGIFITVYFVMFSIIQDAIFSVNISLLVIGFSLFSSRTVKLKHRIIDLSLSWILIFNFAWLTFNTFSRINPDLVLFAFFFAMTIFGCSYFIFNKYKMKFRINKIFPLSIVAIGTSSSITSLVSVFLRASPYTLMSIFSGIFIVFLYYILVDYRYFLWALIPIPITLPLFELLLLIQVIRSIWILAFLTFSIIYITLFQIIFNLFKSSGEKEPEEKVNSMTKIFQDKNQVKLVNFTSFILSSLFISLLISILIPVSQSQIVFSNIVFIYQLLDFLIIWPIFILFSLKYIEKTGIHTRVKDPLRYFDKISLGIYLTIPTALTINILLYLIYLGIDLTLIIYSLILIFSFFLFFEVYIMDWRYFHYLFNSKRNLLTFCSFTIFINTLSLFIFLQISDLLMTQSPIWFFLLVSMISLLNQISINFLSYFNIVKETISSVRVILYYSLFISGSFLLGSLITNGIVLIIPITFGFSYYLLLFQNSFLILFILSNFLMKIEVKLKSSIEILLLIAFQCLFAINMTMIFSFFNVLNIFSLILTILLETGFSFKTVKYLNSLFFEEKKPEFLTKAFSLLIILLYLETSLLFYGLMIVFTGVIESILLSQLVFLVFTILDIYSIKKIKKGYAQLIHTLSFFVISLMILLIINPSVALFPILLSAEVLLFVIMQFYTNYSFFAALHQLYPNKTELLNKRRSIFTQILGVVFYSNIFLLLLQTLMIFNVDLQLMLLVLSILVHVLMLIDTVALKFMGKVSYYLKMFSWMFIMIFTTTFMVYFFVTLITAIPLIIFLLILETAYLFRLLSFSKYVFSRKDKIKKLLFLALYLDFVIWPLFSATLDVFYSLNLILASIGIFFVITYIDHYINVFNEKSRTSLRKISFLIIGVLLSLDIYISMGFIPYLSIFFKLSVALFAFMVFLGVIVKPFKGHSLKAFVFWAAIFSLLSSIVYHLSASWQFGIAVLVITLLIYPFVFLMEELRELFNKFIDFLVKFFKKIKSLIVGALQAFYRFLKAHFKTIWTLFSAFLGLLFGILLSDIVFSLLNPLHATLLAFAIFGLLYLIIPYTQTTDPDIVFKRRVLRLSIGWGSLIGILFIVITPQWYLFTGFISTAVVGTIILVFLGRKEEREKISVKWRFYTLLTLFILLILLGVLFFMFLPF